MILEKEDVAVDILHGSAGKMIRDAATGHEVMAGEKGTVLYAPCWFVEVFRYLHGPRPKVYGLSLKPVAEMEWGDAAPPSGFEQKFYVR